MKFAFGLPVERFKLLKIETDTGLPILPKIQSDVSVYMYRFKKTEIAYLASSYTPDYFLLDTFKYNEYCEAVSDDARSNKVIFRCCFRLDWFDKPWLLGGIIESIIWDRIEKAKPITEKFFI